MRKYRKPSVNAYLDSHVKFIPKSNSQKRVLQNRKFQKILVSNISDEHRLNDLKSHHKQEPSHIRYGNEFPSGKTY